MTKPAPTEDQGDERLEVEAPERAAAGLPAVVGVAAPRPRPDGPAPRGPHAAAPEPDGGLRLPGLRLARAAQDRHGSSSARTAPRPSPRRPRSGGSTAPFFAEHPVSDLAERSDHWLGQQGRLTEPMHRPAGADHYEPISWDDAFGLVAGELNGARVARPGRLLHVGPHEQRGRVPVPAVRAGVRHEQPAGLLEHVPRVERRRRSARRSASARARVTLDDIEQADLILVVGQNPGTNHPRMLTALEQAKRGGARIVAINPLPEAGLIRFTQPADGRAASSAVGTALADLYLQVRVGARHGAVPAAQPARCSRPAAIDEDFIAEHTDGFDGPGRPPARSSSLQTLLGGHRAGPRPTSTSCVDDGRRVRAHDRLLGDGAHPAQGRRWRRSRRSSTSCSCAGSIGKPGAGACPVRGHSNVQGDRTMGIYEKPATTFLDALEARVRLRPAPRARLRHRRRDPGDARRRGRRVLRRWAATSWPPRPTPTRPPRRSRRCRLTVQVSTKLNRSPRARRRRPR